MVDSVNDAKLLGSLGRKNFAVGMLHARKTRWREGHRHALSPEHSTGDVAHADVLGYPLA